MKKTLFFMWIFLALFSLAAFGQDQSKNFSGSGGKPVVEIKIGQIDTSNYPIVRVYIDIYDSDGNLVKNVDKNALQINEKDSSGKVVPVDIQELYQVFQKERIAFNLVMDKSGSMKGTKINDSKAAILNLVDEIAQHNKDIIEISSFDNFVYLDHEFSSDYAKVKQAVQNVRINGMTALYDAIYAALLRVNNQPGAKCVVVFTDGRENKSSYTRQDVLKLASLVNIPVYIIGIGNDVAKDDLSNLATNMLGRYYFVDVVNLRTLLSEVYSDIYNRQRNRYALQYTVPNSADQTASRSVVISGKQVLGPSAGSDRSYIPKANVNTLFSGTYWNSDFIFPQSSGTRLTDSDLVNLSLAELRIARNEIFARHGRQFKDPMLNKWFYSKLWYLKINPKYSPVFFDTNKVSQMSDIDMANIGFIVRVEKDRMKNLPIFPDAKTRILSEYDVSLSKPILKRALNEIYKLEKVPFGQKKQLSAIALKNVDQIELVLNKKDVKY